MADRFQVDPDGLRAVAPRFSRESEHLHEALQTLRSRLDAAGAAWGDDEQGAQFAAQYEPNRHNIEQGVQTLVEGLQSIDKALRVMADNYMRADEAATIRER
ncbi:hypothetical protein TH66_03600 [Carbonactinospora thermoautotrophica]|uniref:ESAT-6-like protein n=1 Tax=Carbonactinospora thermoautotrophica TaxID=1469144 RepID=A0A132NDN3_9ACTN|nr:WXG100 family type VII secretion target [Carbonactinospora thermoautotrophica]KWX05325.1 hypothetical protein TH66_03600 [Carbonactinospora thermoautotrophica]KWX08204.1 hypothetical protein TR74_16020 [Carbonactinospora thermoautotrophica]